MRSKNRVLPLVVQILVCAAVGIFVWLVTESMILRLWLTLASVGGIVGAAAALIEMWRTSRAAQPSG